MLLVLLALLQAPPEADRAPSDVALTPDGRRALAANRLAGTVSLVDLASGAILGEIAVGPLPFATAISRDGRRAVVSCLRSSLAVLRLDPPALERRIDVGYEPRGVALAPDGRTAWVALGGEDAVLAVDLETGRVAGRTPVGEEPWHLALSPDGRRLAVANARSGSVGLIDPATMTLLRTAVFPGARNLRGISITPDGLWVLVPHIVDRGGPTTLRDIEQGKVLVNRLGRVPLTDEGPAEALAMDENGVASADLEDVVVSPDGSRLAVIAGGIRAVLLLSGKLPWAVEPGPVMDPALAKDRTRYRRNALRGRPTAAAFLPDGSGLVVANDLRNELQIVEPAEGEILRAIPLGGPTKPVAAERRGEAVFHDGFRSWHEWYSCATCHPGGHSNGGIYDTFNDGKAGNPKKTLSLRGVAKTGPWTWHGWQKDLADATQGSFRGTMALNPLNREELADVLAYLKTIDFVPPPAPADAEAAKRGAVVFRSRACGDCHAPPAYASKDVVVTGLEAPGDAYKGYNVPPLRGVGRRGPWLHDGRARTLLEVLEKHHRPSTLNRTPDLSPAEAKDLAAFLESL